MKARHRDGSGHGVSILEIADGLNAVLFRQDQVGDDEVGTILLEGGEALFGVFDDVDSVFGSGEDVADDLTDFLIVFDHKDLRHGDPLVGGEGEGSGNFKFYNKLRNK